MHRYSHLLIHRLDPWIVPPVGMTREHARSEVHEAIRTRIQGIEDSFAPPPRIARRLFCDIRFCFPLTHQAAVYSQVAALVDAAAKHVAERPHGAVDSQGEPLRCPILTRRGTPCRREPLGNGYCPSHQHLVEVREAIAV